MKILHFFFLAVENKAKRTNNYTGRHSGDSSYIVNLQFPKDEELLAPMGVGEDGTTVACGADSPAGRVLKSITPVEKNGVVEQVRLDFEMVQITYSRFRNRAFTATDKEFPEQMLEGKVMNLIWLLEVLKKIMQRKSLLALSKMLIFKRQLWMMENQLHKRLLGLQTIHRL